MATERIETRLDKFTIRQLDNWRTLAKPQLSRSDAARVLLEKSLSKEHFFGTSRSRKNQENYPDTNYLGAIYTLERIKGFGPMKFRAMHDAGIDPQAVIDNPDLLPFSGLTGQKLRHAMTSLSTADVNDGRNRAIDQVERAKKMQLLFLLMAIRAIPNVSTTAITLYLFSMFAAIRKSGKVLDPLLLLVPEIPATPIQLMLDNLSSLRWRKAKLSFQALRLELTRPVILQPWSSVVIPYVLCPVDWIMFFHRKIVLFGKSCFHTPEQYLSVSLGSDSGHHPCCCANATS